ncbi:DUF2892 domain-containing protein [Bacillus sp. AGMB 02131]|uniref:DUF2892 domain-containing protein n=1 Tax=Peribacillus faecalis TaxID=2772559 RepID=A0A927CWJ3_9BACI|nr:DUF2892 domain-containing protein [Peribacillus faecalis]MBD3108871.1 DUF2892 domain-containing protein [Peribacillus faecalis]
MKIQQNIGILNAMARITCGLTMLAVITSKMVRRPYKQSYIFIAAAAAMKVAEGIVRYCPMTDMFQRGKGMYSDTMDNIMDAASSLSDEMSMNEESTDQTYNPS